MPSVRVKDCPICGWPQYLDKTPEAKVWNKGTYKPTYPPQPVCSNPDCISNTAMERPGTGTSTPASE